MLYPDTTGTGSSIFEPVYPEPVHPEPEAPHCTVNFKHRTNSKKEILFKDDQISNIIWENGSVECLHSSLTFCCLNECLFIIHFLD